MISISSGMHMPTPYIYETYTGYLTYFQGEALRSREKVAMKSLKSNYDGRNGICS